MTPTFSQHATTATSSHHHSHSLFCVFWSSGGYPKCDCGLLTSAKVAKPVRASSEVYAIRAASRELARRNAGGAA